MKTYIVKGCGVTLECEEGTSMQGWLAYIIERGGVPEVEIKGDLS